MGQELVGPYVWYSHAVTDSLLMPPRSALETVFKPRRPRAIKRPKIKLPKRKRRLPKEPRGEVMNFSCSTVPDGKTSVLMQEVTKRKEQLYTDTGSTTQAATTAATEEVSPEHLHELFNRFVFLSRDDLAACMPMTELRLKYRPIFRKDAVPTCLRRRERLNELKLVYREGFESAFVAVMTEVKHQGPVLPDLPFACSTSAVIVLAVAQ
ncbi:hypothetical protein PR003_g19253 [Phytophthora rubi]|uniref:Uncharacterized protein n=1 Tax=Phytophthora rubi TaxID=129364 RepID=A0A6A4DYU9_9STRA|nr:hypothetical protein PR003_g19253 [Phytophthora rubi]